MPAAAASDPALPAAGHAQPSGHLRGEPLRGGDPMRGEPGADAALGPHAPPAATVRAGDRVLLLEPDTGMRYLVRLDGSGARKEKGLGVFDPARLEGVPYGRIVPVGAKRVAVLRPSLPDLAATLRRKAQVILPKDASRIVHELGVGPGDRVLESGIGSGAATIALLWAVQPGGEVVAQELRPDFAEWAASNVERTGLPGLTVAIGDLTAGVVPGVRGPFQAMLLDQPEPWNALPHALPLLDAGARVACYCPQVSQVEETVRALRSLGFVEARALELIERGWDVKERGSRPSFEGLGHTGFLVFARWLGEPYRDAGPEAPRNPDSATGPQ